MAYKRYKFIKDYCMSDGICFRKGDELKIYIKDNVEYVADGCFPIFRLNTKVAKEYGKIVNRLW